MKLVLYILTGYDFIIYLYFSYEPWCSEVFIHIIVHVFLDML